MSALYRANFARPIPRNVLDLVKAKWEEASAAATGADPLPPFKAFKLSRPRDPHFPGLCCYRRATGDIEESTSMLLDSKPEFWIEIALEGDDEEELMGRLELYVEVVDSVIRTAARREPHLLLKDFPEESNALVRITIPRHVYGNNVPQGKKHIRVAQLTLICELKER
jgi:hypothetical protein